MSDIATQKTPFNWRQMWSTIVFTSVASFTLGGIYFQFRTNEKDYAAFKTEITNKIESDYELLNTQRQADKKEMKADISIVNQKIDEKFQNFERENNWKERRQEQDSKELESRLRDLEKKVR